jgi:hypothetical protein
MNPNLILIREKVKQAAAQNQKRSLVATSAPSEKPKMRSMTSFLIICSLLLSAATFWALFRKKIDHVIAVEPQVIVSKTNSAPKENEPEKLSSPIAEVPPPEKFRDKKYESVNQKLEDNNQKIDELNKKLEVWANRTWLLSVAHNENMNLIHQLQQKQGFRDPGFIVIEENWKLNRLPCTMQMTQEQRQKMLNGIK